MNSGAHRSDARLCHFARWRALLRVNHMFNYLPHLDDLHYRLLFDVFSSCIDISLPCHWSNRIAWLSSLLHSFVYLPTTISAFKHIKISLASSSSYFPSSLFLHPLSFSHVYVKKIKSLEIRLTLASSRRLSGLISRCMKPSLCIESIAKAVSAM